MQQYKLDDIKRMSFRQLGKIEDPMTLSACGSIAPILVRYVVRTGQLNERFLGMPLPVLLDSMLVAASKLPWPAEVGQCAPLGERNADVDTYLDNLQQFEKTKLVVQDLRQAGLSPVTQYRTIKDGIVVDVLDFGGHDILTVDEGGKVTKWTTAGQSDRPHRPVQEYRVTDPLSSMHVVRDLSLALHYVPRR
ncbi:hypothetical protein bAD24_I10810 [Burkholderia sp. AD24]|nr:hypothetical protein bAD24_I10810 [Burkholderia sp. AD24]